MIFVTEANVFAVRTIHNKITMQAQQVFRMLTCRDAITMDIFAARCSIVRSGMAFPS